MIIFFIFLLLILISGSVLIFLFMPREQKTANPAESNSIDIKSIPDFTNIQSELNTLQDSIKTKNSTQTVSIVSRLINVIKNENTGNFYAVCLCHNIINIFLQEIHRIDNLTVAELYKKYQNMHQEKSEYKAENLTAIVLSLSQEIIRILDQEQSVSNTANQTNIINYIHGNYRDSGFCIQSIVDHFGMSLSNLSHQFKSYTGKNISRYISSLRINYAKEMLTTSDLTVNEIAARLGYFQTSSFIKKFKSVEGITPGEYRNVTNKGC